MEPVAEPRDRSGRIGVYRDCGHCGERFVAEKRRPAECCSHGCANRLRAIRAGNRLGQCEVEGCGRDAIARDLCPAHYSRQRLRGHVGEAAIRRVTGGCTTGEGYRLLTVDGRRVLEHRYVMEQVLGRPLEATETVHHRNGVRDDNRPENLEIWLGPHRAGQRLEDQIADAVGVLRRYRPELLDASAR